MRAAVRAAVAGAASAIRSLNPLADR